MTDSTLEVVRKLKQKGTALRNLGNFEGALATFEEAIGELSAMLGKGDLSEEEAQNIRAELADTHGMKGGTYRRYRQKPEHLDLALREYREGLKTEGAESTYNASNVITLAITQEGKSPADAEVSQALNRVISALEGHTREARADEWWAWSDLGQFYLLRNEPERARASYRRGLQTGPTAQERRRHIEILRELEAALKSSQPEISTNLEAAARELE